MQPTCAGSPAPSVTWWKDGSVYDDSYELSPTLEATVANTMLYSGIDSPLRTPVPRSPWEL